MRVRVGANDEDVAAASGGLGLDGDVRGADAGDEGGDEESAIGLRDLGVEDVGGVGGGDFVAAGEREVVEGVVARREGVRPAVTLRGRMAKSAARVKGVEDVEGGGEECHAFELGARGRRCAMRVRVGSRGRDRAADVCVARVKVTSGARLRAFSTRGTQNDTWAIFSNFRLPEASSTDGDGRRTFAEGARRARNLRAPSTPGERRRDVTRAPDARRERRRVAAGRPGAPSARCRAPRGLGWVVVVVVVVVSRRAAGPRRRAESALVAQAGRRRAGDDA